MTEVPAPEPSPQPLAKQKPRKPPVSTHESARVLVRTLTGYFGSREEALNFLRTFAGIQVKYPAPCVLEKVIRDDRIHVALRSEPTTAVARRMSETFHTGLKNVAVAFRARNGGVGLQAARAALKADAVGDGQSDAPHDDHSPERAAPDSSRTSV